MELIRDKKSLLRARFHIVPLLILSLALPLFTGCKEELPSSDILGPSVGGPTVEVDTSVSNEQFLSYAMGNLDGMSEQASEGMFTQLRNRIVSLSNGAEMPDDLLLAGCPQPEQVERVVMRLNQWAKGQRPPENWKLDPMAADINERFTSLPRIESLESLEFDSFDGYALCQTRWLNQIANWKSNSPPRTLDVASRLFDWTVKNIQPDSTGGTPFLPGEALMFGRGTKIDLAWTYILLLRQRGIDAFLLTIDDTIPIENAKSTEPANTGAPKEPSPSAEVPEPQPAQDPAEELPGESTEATSTAGAIARSITAQAADSPVAEAPAATEPVAEPVPEPVAGPAVAGPPVAGPPVAGPPVAGPPVAGPAVDPSMLSPTEVVRPSSAELLKQVRSQWVLVAVLIEGKIYLFDPQVGLPIPAPGGITRDENGGLQIRPATLEEVATRPEPLAAMQLKVAEYPLRQSDFDRMVALLAASPMYLSRRMAMVQANLGGKQFMVLTADPSRLAELIENHDRISRSELWNYPYYVLQRRRNVTRTELMTLLSRRLPFYIGEGGPLRKGRMLYFREKLIGPDSATIAFQRARPSAQQLAQEKMALKMVLKRQNDQAPLSQRKTEKEISAWADQLFQGFAEVQVLARETAGYWLGLIAAEEKNYRSAIDLLEVRTLVAHRGGNWMVGAVYNLARTFEASGQYRRAFELYNALLQTPISRGAMIRAVWLAEELTASGWRPEGAETEETSEPEAATEPAEAEAATEPVEPEAVTEPEIEPVEPEAATEPAEG